MHSLARFARFVALFVLPALVGFAVTTAGLRAWGQSRTDSFSLQGLHVDSATFQDNVQDGGTILTTCGTLSSDDGGVLLQRCRTFVPRTTAQGNAFATCESYAARALQQFEYQLGDAGL